MIIVLVNVLLIELFWYVFWNFINVVKMISGVGRMFLIVMLLMNMFCGSYVFIRMVLICMNGMVVYVLLNESVLVIRFSMKRLINEGVLVILRVSDMGEGMLWKMM